MAGLMPTKLGLFRRAASWAAGCSCSVCGVVTEGLGGERFAGQWSSGFGEEAGPHGCGDAPPVGLAWRVP